MPDEPPIPQRAAFTHKQLGSPTIQVQTTCRRPDVTAALAALVALARLAALTASTASTHACSRV